MASNHFLAAALLGSSVLFVGADASLCAGGGGTGGGRGGAYSGGGFSQGGYGGGGYSYGRAYGFGPSAGGYLGGGLFYGDYLAGGGYFSNAPYGYPGMSGYYSYSAPVPYFAPSIAGSPAGTPRMLYYYAPSAAANSGAAPVPAKPATIQVVLPDPQATVIFDGHKTTAKGTERVYQTPDLTSDDTYSYALRVTWIHDGRQVTLERIVAAVPGQTTNVVFTRADGENAPAAASAK